jgi:hypothetical protein
VFTAASETLRLSRIDKDINDSGRYQAVKPRVLAMDRAACADDIRLLLASPDFVVGSVAAVTEDGALVAASGSGSQLPAYAGGAASASSPTPASAVNRLLILNAEPRPGRGTILLLREAIGF